MRAATPGYGSALMDLRVDGLQPGTYAACVRCVAPCGCESACSPWAILPLACFPCGVLPLAPASHIQAPSAPAPVAALMPNLSPPPPVVPSSLPITLREAAAGIPSSEDTISVALN